MESTAGLVTVGKVETRSNDPGDVAVFLAAHPELESRLPEIEKRVLRHFGPGARLERTVFHPLDEEDPEDVFILHVIGDLSFDEKMDRLNAFIDAEDEFIAHVRRHLTIGIL